MNFDDVVEKAFDGSVDHDRAQHRRKQYGEKLGHHQVSVGGSLFNTRRALGVGILLTLRWDVFGFS